MDEIVKTLWMTFVSLPTSIKNNVYAFVYEIVKTICVYAFVVW